MKTFIKAYIHYDNPFSERDSCMLNISNIIYITCGSRNGFGKTNVTLAITASINGGTNAYYINKPYTELAKQLDLFKTNEKDDIGEVLWKW